VTSNAGAHFDVASTWKRDVPFIGPVGEVGFNHFDGATIVSLMGGLRVREYRLFCAAVRAIHSGCITVVTATRMISRFRVAAV
jgi:hypothetical protein